MTKAEAERLVRSLDRHFAHSMALSRSQLAAHRIRYSCVTCDAYADPDMAERTLEVAR